jgi:hypothetical protein
MAVERTYYMLEAGLASDIALEPHVGFRGTPDIVPSGAPSASVANDPVTSQSWNDEKVFAPDQVLEVHWVDGSRRVARKERRPDE